MHVRPGANPKCDQLKIFTLSSDFLDVVMAKGLMLL